MTRKPKATVTVVLTGAEREILARSAQLGLDMGWVLYPKERDILTSVLLRLRLRRARVARRKP